MMCRRSKWWCCNDYRCDVSVASNNYVVATPETMFQQPQMMVILQWTQERYSSSPKRRWYGNFRSRSTPGIPKYYTAARSPKTRLQRPLVYVAASPVPAAPTEQRCSRGFERCLFGNPKHHVCLQRSRGKKCWRPRVEATPGDENAPVGPCKWCLMLRSFTSWNTKRPSKWSAFARPMARLPFTLKPPLLF